MKRRWLGLGLVAVTVACSTPAEEPARDDAEINAGAPRLCAAVRGNGTAIATHFASLARIVEHYGVIDGYAGGSSGSISAFFYQSMRKNPAIASCGDEACSPEQLAPRVSLALKSLEGYALTVASSDEGVAIGDLVALVSRLKREVAERNIEALVKTDVPAAAAKLKEVLSIPELRGIVNPEALAMLQDVEHLAFNVKEVQASIATLGAFAADDNRSFFRPGILNWDALVPLLGRIADFYAGSAPAAVSATAAWLDACAAPALGQPWSEASSLPYAARDGETCGAAFSKLVADYRAKARDGRVASKRLTERVGDGSSVRALVSTSVLEGDAIPAFQRARASYLDGAHPTGMIPFAPSFSDVKFGYWGARQDTDAVLASRDAAGAPLKTQKASSLGNETWRDVLKASPAEPGLSRFVELADGRISGGGWSDLAPTTVLESMGCERIVYVTREGDESGFATKIAKHLGMDEATWKELYDLDSPTSSFNRSLEAADAVWCTNWNAFSDSQQREKIADSWQAPLEAREGFAGIDSLAPYSRTTARTGKPGCTPGVSGGARYPE